MMDNFCTKKNPTQMETIDTIESDTGVIMLGARIELARVSPHAPQTCASTSSAIRACHPGMPSGLNNRFKASRAKLLVKPWSRRRSRQDSPKLSGTPKEPQPGLKPATVEPQVLSLRQRPNTFRIPAAKRAGRVT